MGSPEKLYRVVMLDSDGLEHEACSEAQERERALEIASEMQEESPGAGPCSPVYYVVPAERWRWTGSRVCAGDGYLDFLILRLHKHLLYLRERPAEELRAADIEHLAAAHSDVHRMLRNAEIESMLQIQLSRVENVRGQTHGEETT